MPFFHHHFEKLPPSHLKPTVLSVTVYMCECVLFMLRSVVTGSDADAHIVVVVVVVCVYLAIFSKNLSVSERELPVWVTVTHQNQILENGGWTREYF